MLEEDVENPLVRLYKKAKGVAFNFKSPGKRGVPDRLCLLPVPQEHIAIVHRYVKFVECKSPTGTLSPHQKTVRKGLAKMGYPVIVLARPIKHLNELELI